MVEGFEPYNRVSRLEETTLSLEEAFLLFRRLGVDVPSLSPRDFTAAYFQLAWRHHPDLNRETGGLMAAINAARTTILQSYRWPEAAPQPKQRHRA